MSILKSTKEAHAAQAAAATAAKAAAKAAEEAAAARAAKEAAAADADTSATAPVGAKLQALGSAASALLSRARAATKPAAKNTGSTDTAAPPETTPETPLTPVGSVEYQAPAGETAPAPAKGLQRYRSVLRPLGVGILVLGVLFFVLQAYLLGAQRDAAQTLHTAAQQALPVLAKPLKNARENVAAATKNPHLLTLLAQPGDDASARVQAVQRMQELLPQAQAVTFFAPNADALVDTNLAKLGYVRAAQLARAHGSNNTQVSVITHAGKHTLSVVQPVQQGPDTLAFAAVDLPFTAVAKAFAGLSIPRGRVDLRLAGRGDAPALLSRGASPETDIDYADRVPGSGLWLTTAQPASAAMLPVSTSPALAWVVAILCFLGALAIAAGERRLRALPQRVRGQGGRGAGGEPTFAQVLSTEVKTSPAATASAQRKLTEREAAGVAVERSIFRAYDIRGVLGETLDAGVARLIGQAIGSAARDQGMTEIVVGRDGRLSGPELVDALSDGLRASGMDVIDIGAMPTPVVYFACYHLNTRTGVVVTGSHNPPDYNGFKIVIDNVTLAEDAIQDLYERITEGRFREGRGELRHVDVAADYIKRIASDVQTERPLNVVVDCGNGIAGTIAPQVLEAIGANVTPLYDEVDGSFPNHHPDPSDPRNLADLILAVKHQNADLGIAFDGDADRLGVVTRDADIIYADRLLMLFAMDVLARDPGATIIYDVKCTGHLQSMVLRHGGSPLMWRTGHSLIKAKMRETGAALAGEMSGHFFFKERWYGFDDGIYAAARLLEILASDIKQRTPEQIFAALPQGVSTPELKIDMPDGARFMADFSKQAHFQDARVTKIDGVRADWSDGWGLVRASNTTPTLVLRFDADTDAALERIQDVFRAQLLALDADLKLPF